MNYKINKMFKEIIIFVFVLCSLILQQYIKIKKLRKRIIELEILNDNNNKTINIIKKKNNIANSTIKELIYQLG